MKQAPRIDSISNRRASPRVGGESATVRDLIAAAADRRQPVPVLLALTVLVQTLRSLDEARRRGAPLPPVRPENLALHGAPLDDMLSDPTRDPGIVPCGVAPARPAEARPAEARPAEARGTEVQAAGAVFHELLCGTPPEAGDDELLEDLPAPVARLLRGLLDPRPESRLGLQEALAEARALGLERLARWDADRRRPRLETSLRDALDLRHEPRVRELATELAEIAPGSPWVAAARRWLDVRARAASRRQEARRGLLDALYRERRRDVLLWGTELRHALGTEGEHDPDLTIARQWLREHDERESRRRQRAKKVSVKLLLTGAPLIFATLLTGLLAVVMFFSDW